MRGRLIAVEGLDGVGKTTLSKALAEALGARWTTTPGAWIRQVRPQFDATFARSPEARSLAYGATVIAAGREAEAELNAGRDVVIDRYWLSTLAYAPHTAWEALGAMSAHVLPATVTLYLTAADATRRARMATRGALSPADRDTLEPGKGRWLDQRFRSFREDAAAGAFVVLSADVPPDALLGDALARLREPSPVQCPLFEESEGQAPRRRAM